MATDINTHGMIVPFGKHKGEPWTRVPVSYLKWLVNLPNPQNAPAKAIAAAELKRRGSSMPTIELSGHAIDRASLNCRKMWYGHRKDENEGLYSWLARAGREALDACKDPLPSQGEIEIRYAELKWVFVLGDYYPTVKTVMPA
jgi:hypothetical protein